MARIYLGTTGKALRGVPSLLFLERKRPHNMHYDPAFRERRTFARFTIPIEITYSDFEHTQGSVYAQTNDISAQGLGLVSAKGLIPGSSLAICFHMVDNGEKICAKGKLIWSSILESGKYRAGVKIVESKLNAIMLVLRTIKAKKKY